jgi:hypothetical protein
MVIQEFAASLRMSTVRKRENPTSVSDPDPYHFTGSKSETYPVGKNLVSTFCSGILQLFI